jgi:predicted nucleotidyltransferase
MAKKHATPVPHVQPYRYRSPDVPLPAIRRFARQIAARVRSQKIILFGSYAYGKPHAESDVDLLVIMPAADVVRQAVRICLAFARPLALDLIVRTPRQIERGLKDDDWFLREVVGKGITLYEAANGEVGPQGRGGLGRAQTSWPPASRRCATWCASIASRRRRSTSRPCCKKAAPPCPIRMTSIAFSTYCCPTTPPSSL